MTICIAAMCNIDTDPAKYSPGIVFCADKLLTSSISFEHGTSKIKLIPNRCVVMEAGDATISDLILDKDIINVKNSSLDVKEIAELINDKMIKVMQHKIEDEVLSTFRLNLELLTRDSEKMNSDLLNFILRQISQIKKERTVCFIVAGLDKDALPQLYRISSTLGLECHNSNGFISIGIGADLSLLELTKSSHSSRASYVEVIFKVYSAKRKSEKAGGIGRKTDFGMLYLKEADKNDENWMAGDILLGDNIQSLLDKQLERIDCFETDVRKKVKPKLKGLLFEEKEPKEPKLSKE